MSERCFAFIDFTHKKSAGCLSLYEVGLATQRALP